MTELVKQHAPPVVRSTGAMTTHEPPSILGGNQSIQTSGKIRPGVKVLTKKFAENPKVVKIYHDGMAAGISSGDIEKQIKAALGMEPSDRLFPLTPKNVPYFTVRRSDFTVPAVADRIIEKYGEDRGEGIQVYGLPVVFPSDDWLQVLPHKLECYTARQLKYWSEYGADGVRYCKMKAKPQIDAKTKRAVRHFGGRPSVLRDENEGRCVPEECPEYQKGDCKLRGKLKFYIQDIPGTGVFELSTSSFYGMDGIQSQLKLMLYGRGRISGTHNGEAMFYLTKRQEEVSMLDPESGEPKRVHQWIPVLEGRMDMTRLLASAEDDDEAEHEAIAVLEGRGSHEEDDDDDHVIEHAGADDVVDGEFSDGGAPTLQELQSQSVELLRKTGIMWPAYIEYLDEVYGDGWKQDLKKLASIVDELSAVNVDDPDELAVYQDRVRNKAPF